MLTFVLTCTQLLERDVAAEEARVDAAREAQRQKRAQQTKAAADCNRLQLQRKVGFYSQIAFEYGQAGSLDTSNHSCA